MLIGAAAAGMIRTRVTSSGVASACAVDAAIAPPRAASTGERDVTRRCEVAWSDLRDARDFLRLSAAARSCGEEN